jgi:hypothetical protein
LEVATEAIAKVAVVVVAAAEAIAKVAVVVAAAAEANAVTNHPL